MEENGQTENSNGKPESDQKQAVPNGVTAGLGEVFVAVFNGMGVGLLLGLLIGLAVSPVVSGIIGTLSSLLVVLLGLNDKHLTLLKGLRIGSFGLFTFAGIIVGTYIRAHDALSPKTTDLMKEYEQAGFEENQALYYVALKKFDYVPVGWFGTSEIDTLALATTDKSDKTILFSTIFQLNVCNELDDIDESFPREEVLYAFEEAGGVWEKLARSMPESMPDQAYRDGLIGIRDAICKNNDGPTRTIEENKSLRRLNYDSTPAEIKSALQQAGGVWASILENTEQKIPAENQLAFYLTLINILNNEEKN